MADSNDNSRAQNGANGGGRPPQPCVCALNDLCDSLSAAVNREAFRKDTELYCNRFDLNAAQRRALAAKDLPSVVEQGAAPESVLRLAQLWDLNPETEPGRQNGMSVEAFRAKLLSGARDG